MIDFFVTLHVEARKEIEIEEIMDDISDTLDKNQYNIVGGVGITEIEYEDEYKKRAKDCHKAWAKHYEKIKNIW